MWTNPYTSAKNIIPARILKYLQMLVSQKAVSLKPNKKQLSHTYDYQIYNIKL